MCLGFVILLWLAASALVRGATLSDTAVDRYNMRVGTQTFSGLYQFTTNTLLVETAEAIQGMGTDYIKIYLGPDFVGKYRITLGPNITNLLTLARSESSVRYVLNMRFKNIIAWAYPFAYWWPFDGYSASEAASEYREIYDLTHYLLTNYNNSGKTFYLGHWEGDGYLTGGVWTTNPTPTMVQGFIDCLNNRQSAVDDAKQATLFTNVNVFCYAEANRVLDAISGYHRMINYVVPYVTNLDYLSYSSYDAQRLSGADLTATLDYAEAHLPTNKVSVLPGERIWIGEYGFANGGDTPAQQEPESRAYIQRLLNYGRQGIPYILFWEIYDNETNTDGSYKYFYLIDENGLKAPCYYLHQRFINNARLLTAQFKETNGRLPNDSEWVPMVTPMLNQPLPPPVGLTISNLNATMLSNTAATVSGILRQGIYGDDLATVSVFFGRNDGAAVPAAWEQIQMLGINTNFNPKTFTALLTNLVPDTNYFFRFYASNVNAEAWAPSSWQFSTAFQQIPQLSISYEGGELKLSWPAGSPGWGLYTAINVGVLSVWTVVTNQPELLNGQWQMTLPLDGEAMRFYRLQH